MQEDRPQIYLFGEVLFDCFPGGERVLGGAPFNVAWHLHAFGDQPQLISRVGRDHYGEEILSTMQAWGLDTSWIQRDAQHPTGQVAIEMHDGEPHYTITAGCAYDYIDVESLHALPQRGILYHGTLGMRSEVSRGTFESIIDAGQLDIFLDVNLRAPYWSREDVYHFLHQARWVKLNVEELRQLGFNQPDLWRAMAAMQQSFQLQHLLLTLGAEGARLITAEGEQHSVTPATTSHIVDTVGAGDAFSSVYLHGLLCGWSIARSLEHAQQFASRVVGLRGATTDDPAFYADYSDWNG